MSQFTKQEHTIRWIPTKGLCVQFAAAQRGLDERKVAQIQTEFDPDFVGVVVVTLPIGDTALHHVIDGQHRVEAIRRMWGAEEKVPCIVLNTTDPKRAADIFRQINGKRSKPQALDMFRVGVTAGYEGEVAVNKLITDMGYRLGFASEDGAIRAVSSCMAIYRKHGINHLRDVLLVIQATFGRTAESVDGVMLNGYSAFLATHGMEVERKRLVERVAKLYTPSRLIGAARNMRDLSRCGVAEGVARVLANTYNHGLKHNKLNGAAKPNGTGKSVKRRPSSAYDSHSGIGVH